MIANTNEWLIISLQYLVHAGDKCIRSKSQYYRVPKSSCDLKKGPDFILIQEGDAEGGGQISKKWRKMTKNSVI